MDIITGNVGWIEVICGPMFSGKSEELIRRLRRAMIARKRVEVFKPAIDNRYSEDEIVSHGDIRMKSEVVNAASEILARLDWRTQVVGVDEANFLGPELIEIAKKEKLESISANVLAGNREVQRLAASMGFSVKATADPMIVHTELKLN